MEGGGALKLPATVPTPCLSGANRSCQWGSSIQPRLPESQCHHDPQDPGFGKGGRTCPPRRPPKVRISGELPPAVGPTPGGHTEGFWGQVPHGLGQGRLPVHLGGRLGHRLQRCPGERRGETQAVKRKHRHTTLAYHTALLSCPGLLGTQALSKGPRCPTRPSTLALLGTPALARGLTAQPARAPRPSARGLGSRRGVRAAEAEAPTGPSGVEHIPWGRASQ